jgi:hypothetical protein
MCLARSRPTTTENPFVCPPFWCGARQHILHSVSLTAVGRLQHTVLLLVEGGGGFWSKRAAAVSSPVRLLSWHAQTWRC